jgi:phage protein D
VIDLFAPGMSFNAPQVRVFDVERNQDHEANRDVVSASVTLVNHGVSHAEITLNNHRADNPTYPPWKYNAFDLLAFGQRLRIDFRYGTAPWVPMILVRVTDLQFSFPTAGGAKLTVIGEDLLSLLKTPDRNRQDKRYAKADEMDMVVDVLSRSACGLPLAPPQVPRVVFADKLRTVIHSGTQTFLQFLESLAERMDYELFVDFDDPTNPDSPLSLHFEPARSLGLLGGVDLEWGKNLSDFRPSFKVWEQYTKVTVKGTHPQYRRIVEKDAGDSEVKKDLQKEAGQPAPMSAIEARTRFFPDDQGSRNPYSLSVTGLDEQRAELKAARELRQRAREFLTATGSTIGFTDLRPGIHINLSGLRPPFDGLYYITQTTHTVDSGGYRTGFLVRRPGMLEPSLYLAPT